MREIACAAAMAGVHAGAARLRQRLGERGHRLFEHHAMALVDDELGRGDVERALDEEMPLHAVPHSHGLQHRAERVVEHHDMGRAAADGERQGRLPGQRILRQHVQERLHQSGIGRLVGRRDEHDAVRLLDKPRGAFDRRIAGVAREQRMRRQGTHTDVPGPHAEPLERGADMLREPARLGDRSGTAGDDEHEGHATSSWRRSAAR